MKTLTIAFTLLAVVLLSSSGLLVTHGSSAYTQSSNKHSSQQLSMGLQGVITNAGNQKWALSGGNLYGAQFGQEQVPAGANFHYSMRANVNGLSASGYVQLSLTGTTADGQTISFNANGQIVGMIPSICFPSYASPDANENCPSTDTSAIPGFFVAMVSTSETLGTTTTTSQTTLLIETPILNPFGSAIAIMSTDGSISVMTTYQTGTATWTNVQLTGTVSGTLNSQPASGSFSQVANANENFVTGYESEYGSLSLQSMSPSSLDAKGYYVGSSTVPILGSFDCAALAGLPEGTCTETGLSSTGSFLMMGSTGTVVAGSYSVTWPAPSVTFAGIMTATVTN